MAKHYDELSGAAGKARFFRPKRFSADEIFSGAAPSVWFDDCELRLKNISATGVACTHRAGSESLGAREGSQGRLRLVQRGRDIFSANAILAREEIDGTRELVAFTLKQAQFDLSDIAKASAKALVFDGAKLTPDIGAPDKEYKAFCADVLAFVGEHLTRIERYLMPVEANFDWPHRQEIFDEFVALAKHPWEQILSEGNRLVVPHHNDKSSRLAIKSFTERTLTRKLVGGPNWARSYFKPAGYPGDYLIMDGVYNPRPLGDSLEANFLHALGLISGGPIITRMEKLSEIIATHGASLASRGEPVRILSVGSGPAEEIRHILDLSPPDLKWDITLIDQDEQALGFALSKARRLDAPDRLSVTALNVSFKDMLNPNSMGALVAEQDLIYSSGLVDYLNPLLARRFVKRMGEYLRPGGKLVIGNVNNLDTGMIWQCEYILDWSMFFRSKDEMLAMAGANQEANILIEADSRNAVYFLTVTKPER